MSNRNYVIMGLWLMFLGVDHLIAETPLKSFIVSLAATPVYILAILNNWKPKETSEGAAMTDRELVISKIEAAKDRVMVALLIAEETPLDCLEVDQALNRALEVDQALNRAKVQIDAALAANTMLRRHGA